MPSFKHVIEIDYKPTFRTQKVAGLFDVSVKDKLKKEWDVNIPIEERPWKIGLITGASGSGKTTIANKLFENKVHKSFEWKSSCLLDDFPQNCEINLITETLSKVGFSSPPSWLLPYSSLSNGQKFRVELARCLLEYKDLFVFDEFTSVVDRQVAQIGAFAFQKVIRKTEKQFVAVTCHYDVEEWLEPDWVFDMSTNTFKWGSLRRPKIEIEISRVHYSAWKLFKEHHYLDANLSISSSCYCAFINKRPVAFTAWLPFIGKLKGDKLGRRAHRTVTVPDFQGLGIGNILVSEIAKMWKTLGYRVFSTTSHPSMINKRIKDKNWILTHQGHKGNESVNSSKKIKHATNRLVASFEYIGETMNYKEAQLLRNNI